MQSRVVMILHDAIWVEAPRVRPGKPRDCWGKPWSTRWRCRPCRWRSSLN